MDIKEARIDVMTKNKILAVIKRKSEVIFNLWE